MLTTLLNGFFDDVDEREEEENLFDTTRIIWYNSPQIGSY